MPRQPEGKIVQKIKDQLKQHGARPFKIHGSDEGFQEVGIPDLLVCLSGRFMGIEVKQPGEPLRARQKLVLHEIFDAGGIAAVVETVGQSALLLSYLKQGDYSEKAILYYRGTVYHQWPNGNPLR